MFKRTHSYNSRDTTLKIVEGARNISIFFEVGISECEIHVRVRSILYIANDGISDEVQNCDG